MGFGSAPQIWRAADRGARLWAEIVGHDNRGDGGAGGFDAQDRGRELDATGALCDHGGLKKGRFARRPAALGAHQREYVGGVRLSFARCCGGRRFVRVQPKDLFGWRGALQDGFEGAGLKYLHQIIAATLLGGFDREPAPLFDFLAALAGLHHAAVGVEPLDGGDVELAGLFDEPVGAVAFGHGGGERETDARGRGEFNGGGADGQVAV